MKLKGIEEMGTQLCNYCSLTDKECEQDGFGEDECDEAYENYLEQCVIKQK